MRAAAPVSVILLGLVLAGCVTSFSPERERSEIALQTGADAFLSRGPDRLREELLRDLTRQR